MIINRCISCMEELESYPCPHCGYVPDQSPEARGHALAPYTILNGKYLVGKVLGQGGFGITYIGFDLSLGTKVAVKEFFPAGQVMRDPATGSSLVWATTAQAKDMRSSGVDTFIKEARKMARVSDVANVVNVREIFSENQTAYIVMEYIDGETLKDKLQKTGVMDWEQAKEIFLPAISAMEQVHKAGLIHRDLSPDNLMLRADGTVKILDLGASKDLNVNSGASSMLVAKGGFSPLEQYTQRGGSGPWTDVYAMAATMYYALTGVLPPSAIDRLAGDTLRWDLPQLTALPGNVYAALHRGMAVMTENRTQTMADFLRELTEAPRRSAPAPIAPKVPPKVPESKPKKVRRKIPPKKILATAAVTLGIVIAAYCGLYLSANALAQNGNLSAAGKLLVLRPVTRLHDAELCDYVKAYEMMSQTRYAEAVPLLKSLPGYKAADDMLLEAKYQWAHQRREKHQFDDAVALFTELAAIPYRDSADWVPGTEYYRGCYLMEQGEYSQAIFTFNKLAEAGYADSEQKLLEANYQAILAIAYEDHNYASAFRRLCPNGKTVSSKYAEFDGFDDTIVYLKTQLYTEGVQLYHAKNYDAAYQNLTLIPGYLSTGRYMDLIAAHRGTYSEGNADRMVKHLSFEDTKSALVASQMVAEDFLEGTWRTSSNDKYFIMKSNGDISYNLPHISYGNYYRIGNGKLYFYPADDESAIRLQFTLTVLSADSIKVTCAKDGSTYTLYRK